MTLSLQIQAAKTTETTSSSPNCNRDNKTVCMLARFRVVWKDVVHLAENNFRNLLMASPASIFFVWPKTILLYSMEVGMVARLE